MKITDYIALAKAGYKKSEIEKIMAEAEEPEEVKPEPEPEKIEEKTDPEEKPEEPKDDEPDYKEMYEEVTKSLDEMKAKLEQAQKANRKQEAGTPKQPDEEMLINIVRDFL